MILAPEEFFLCIFAIGVSFVLVGIPIDGLSEITYPVCGFVIILLSIMGVEWWGRKRKKELEKIDGAIEFMCNLTLKIEGKLLKGIMHKRLPTTTPLCSGNIRAQLHPTTP